MEANLKYHNTSVEELIVSFDEDRDPVQRDIVLIILSKMLRVTILCVVGDYLWLSTPYVNVVEASIVIVFGKTFTYNTGI